MSEEQKEEIIEIIRNAHEVVNEAREARKVFVRLSKILLILIVGAISTVSVLIYSVNRQGNSIEFLNRNFVPMFLIESIAENDSYQTQELVSTMGELVASFKGDEKLIAKYNADVLSIRTKYSEFKRDMVKQIGVFRGSFSSTTRSIKSGGETGGNSSK